LPGQPNYFVCRNPNRIIKHKTASESDFPVTGKWLKSTILIK
jgi:hypothetical protein